MRRTSFLATGLIGFLTLPAVAAGPVGLDAVTQWLRGITGEAAPAPPATAAPGAAAPATTSPTSRPTTQQGAAMTRSAPPRDGVERGGTDGALADLDDLAATLSDTDAAALGIDRPGAIRGASASADTAMRGTRPQRDRLVTPTGQLRTLADDSDADEASVAPNYRLGSFVLRPQLDVAAGTSSNLQGRAGGTAGGTYRLNSELGLESDWSRHGFTASLRGGYDGYPSETDLNAPRYDGAANLRLDLMDATRADLALRFGSARGKASAAENPAGTVVPSTTTTTGLSIGVTREAGLVGLTLRGDVDRTGYSGGELASGGVITADEARDNTRVAVALRASLDDGAVLRPFAEVQALRRGYDADSMSGRDSRGFAGRVGARVDLGPILSGEAAIGWTRESLTDAALPDLQGVLFDATILWSPTRLTQIGFTARTTLDPTTLAGSSGAVGRNAGVTVRHALTRDITASLGASGEVRHYEGIALRERTVSGDAEIAYRFDPHMEVYGRGAWSRFSTSAAGGDYDAVTVLAGVRLR